MASLSRPSALASEGEAIVRPDRVDFSFGVGVFRFAPDSERLISIAIIAETTGRFLVALPVKAWDKVKAKRVLPQPVLERPVSASIAGCTAEDRLTPSEPTSSCMVWVGFLKKDFWSCVSFGSELQPTLDFEDSDSGKELADERYVYACLCTLAMGDSAACDYAQTSHLSMGLQCGCFRQENMISLYGRVPRDNFMAGIIIDDFIVLEKIALDATTGIRANESRRLMHDMNKQVGLDAHPTRGLLMNFLLNSGVLLWTALMVWVTSRVAHMGLCSVGLLKSWLGALSRFLDSEDE